MASRWAESALGWWEDAGVDTIVGEEPRDWLAPPRPAAARPAGPAEAPAAPPPPVEAIPDALPAFQAWLAESDAIPFAAPGVRRVAPAGDPAAGVMVIGDVPSLEDSANGILFSGEQGVLVDAMLKAIGLGRETIYLAPFSPIRPTTGRIDPESVRVLTDIMRHHIGLVSPRALLIFGDSCSRALLGLNMAQARGRWHEVETPRGPIRALVTIRPQELIAQPKNKAHAWADLKLLMEGLKP